MRSACGDGCVRTRAHRSGTPNAIAAPDVRQEFNVFRMRLPYWNTGTKQKFLLRHSNHFGLRPIRSLDALGSFRGAAAHQRNETERKCKFYGSLQDHSLLGA